MDYVKAKVILKKLSTLIDSFESLGEPISEIESEILHKYIEKLGQLIPSESESSEPSKQPSLKEKATKSVIGSTPEAKPIQGESSQEENISKSANSEHEKEVGRPKPIATVPEVPEEEIEIEIVDEDAKTASQKKEVPPIKVQKKKVLVSTEDDDADGDTSDLWAPVEIKELSHKLSFSPIKNIFKSISINERILTLNELFDGDSKAFKETLDHLETFDNFEDAAEYLRKGVAADYQWEEGEKLKKANNFMKIVQRRFL